MLDLKRHRRDSSLMPATLAQVMRDALALSPRQKLFLAEILIESADVATDSGAEVAWDAEIGDRIRAIDESRIVGVAYQDVMRSAVARLVP